MIVHIYYNLTKFYWVILIKVCAGVTRTDWLVQPSVITKKNGERYRGEDGMGEGREKGTLRRNKIRFALASEILHTARAMRFASPIKQQTSFLTPALF